MLTSKLRNAGSIVLGLALVVVLFQNCAKDMPSTEPAAQDSSSQLPETRPVLRLGSAMQSANLQTTGGTWVDIPGLSISFTINEDRTIHMSALGSVSQVNGNQASGHCGFRFVVNGTPYGDPTWGDQIVQVYNWTAWHTERHLPLVAGTHNVKVQQVGWSGTTAGCTSNTNAYSAARMTLVAY
jgi:hypothetical protein